MTIDDFREAIMSLKPANFMALNGVAPAVFGSADSGTDAIFQLQRTTIDFTDTFKTGSNEAIQAGKREVIGKIMVAVALDALAEDKADELVEALVELTKGKN